MTGLYQEGGWYAHVLILADNSDVDFERYTLQILQAAQVTGFESALSVGTRFEYLRRRGVLCYGMPQLVIDEV